MFWAALAIAIVAITGPASSWDPDAGIIQSYTKSSNVTVSATSGSSFGNVVDGDDNTNWVSGSCLPTFFLGRADENIFHDACANGQCASTVVSELSAATDGSVYTTALIQADSGNATFTLKLVPPKEITVLTVNGIYNADTVLYVYDTSGGPRQQLATYNSSDNYKSMNSQHSNFTVSKIELSSSADFRIKELGALGTYGCIEELTVDLALVKSIGTIRTRHWAGTNAASSLDLSVSVDGASWTKVASLDPNALHAVTTSIPVQPVRYIRLRYVLNMKNYQKVYCFEIDAWDENGVWGPKMAAKPQSVSFRNLLGVNGIWGWGTQKYSSSLGDNEGPKLYNQVASHARNYHNLKWDVTDPDLDPEYSEMVAGRGTQASWWLNWDKEYRAWKEANMTTDISIQFTAKTVPQSEWNAPETSAYHYGHEFSKHFGSVQGVGLVDAVEVGNEPWDYDASFYATVLRGMAAGLRSGDSLMTIVAGTFQAHDQFDIGTYIGTRVLEDVATTVDVVNCHTYSFVNDVTGVRRGTYPENKHSSFNNIRPLQRWRDANMPGKPVWVTEWGWDAEGSGERCQNTECVSDKAQAVYAIRGFMVLARSNIERATWYFYANLDCETLFCRSGLTTSAADNFQKRTVFVIFEEFLGRLGDSYFLADIQESDNGYIYALSSTSKPNFHSDNTTTILSEASHIIAWLPVDIDDLASADVTLTLPPKVQALHGTRFTGSSTSQPVTAENSFTQNGRDLTFTIATEPYLIEIGHGSTGPIVG